MQDADLALIDPIATNWEMPYPLTRLTSLLKNTAISPRETVAHRRGNISRIEIQSADFLVTATGVKNALSNEEMQVALSSSQAVLANMGVEDEFSDETPEDRVLNEKLPLKASH